MDTIFHFLIDNISINDADILSKKFVDDQPKFSKKH